MLQFFDSLFTRFCERLRVSRRFVAMLLTVLLALCLVPSLYAGRYVMPQADDFGFSARPHAVWEETGSLGAVLASAARETCNIYRDWQGSYSACFLMYLQPGQFGEGWYSLTPWLLFGAWLLGTVLLCRRLCAWLNVPHMDSILFTTTLLLLQLLLVPYPNESFYWYNGAIYYTFFYAVTLGLLALLARSHTFTSRAAVWGCGAAFVAFGAFLGGGPFSLILVTLFLWARIFLAAALPLCADGRAARLVRWFCRERALPRQCKSRAAFPEYARHCPKHLPRTGARCEFSAALDKPCGAFGCGLARTCAIPRGTHSNVYIPPPARGQCALIRAVRYAPLPAHLWYGQHRAAAAHKCDLFLLSLAACVQRVLLAWLAAKAHHLGCGNG